MPEVKDKFQDTFLSPTEIINQMEQQGMIHDFLREDVLNDVEKVLGASSELYQRISNISYELIDIIDQFDYLLVSGGSRSVSATILQACGVDQCKIIKFSRESNNDVYKEKKWKGKVAGVERSLSLLNVLQDSQVDMEANPSICIVDDYLNTGGKAGLYLLALHRINHISNFAYATFAAPMLEDDNPDYSAKSAKVKDVFRFPLSENECDLKLAEELLSKIIYSQNYSFDEMSEIMVFLQSLAKLTSKTSQKNQFLGAEFYPEEYIKHIHRLIKLTVQESQKKLYNHILNSRPIHQKSSS